MNLSEAISCRHSQRVYTNKPLEEEIGRKLNKSIGKYNKEADLHMQLVVNHTEAFQGFLKSYGMFQGVSNYIAMVGKKEDTNLKEKLGYYGELLVLEATALGLGTCWVGGTYDKKSCFCEVLQDECIICVITIGYIPEQKAFREKLLYSMMHRKTKGPEELYRAEEPVPEWFLPAMRAVQMAPSAVNRQPVLFTYKDKEITAGVKDRTEYERIDLGIAKLHFELAAGNGKWNLGNHEAYILKK